jgi:nucleotide-binding universal stress UspA family protein
MTISEKHLEQADGLVSAAVERVTNENLNLAKVEKLVLKGDPKTEILALLQRLRPELVVTGTRRHENLSKMFFGSLSHAVLLAARCSVRICRARRSGGNKVMLALDGSKSSSYALEAVASHPWNEGCEIICVSAIPSLAETSYQFQDIYAMADLERNRSLQVSDRQAALDSAVAFLQERLTNCTIRSKVVDGEPKEALLKVAEEESIDLIILGSAGKNLAERLVVGSVSETVAVCADCSVEVIVNSPTRQDLQRPVPIAVASAN